MGSTHESTASSEVAGTPVDRATSAPPDRVWDVLVDAWTYAGWVVGASRVRSVDADWPRPGTHLHHSVGVWPLVRDDRTTVLEVDAARRRLRMCARVRPFGTQVVEITVDPDGEGSLVTMWEDASGGLARLAPPVLRRGALRMRNREALHRLCLLAERETRAEEA